MCRYTILSTNLTSVVPSQNKKENQSIFNFGFTLPKFRFVDVVYVSSELKQFSRLGCCEWSISLLEHEVNYYTTVTTAETS